MSNYHITHERLKRNRSANSLTAAAALNGINGTVSSTHSIHHRIPVIDGRVRSPISGKMVSVDDILTAHSELFVHVMPRMNTGYGTEQLLFVGINRGEGHTRDWHSLIDDLTPVKG